MVRSSTWMGIARDDRFQDLAGFTRFWEHVTIQMGMHVTIEMARHVTIQMGMHVTIEMARHVTIEMGKHVTIEMARHVTIEMGKHVTIEMARHVTIKISTARDNWSWGLGRITGKWELTWQLKKLQHVTIDSGNFAEYMELRLHKW
jgi:phage anti-repressor protein